MSQLAACADHLQRSAFHRRIGWVRRVQGLAIEAEGPPAAVGELCRIEIGTPDGLLAQVVALRPDHVTLLAFGDVGGVAAGARVTALGARSGVAVGPALLGRVIDGLGRPLDGRPAPACASFAPLEAAAGNPLHRPAVREVLETGVRVVDALLTLGRGQRVGLFAGSGVGKSRLLGRMARHARADLNVVALVGERGREVREFVDGQLGPEGLARSVVIAATSDQPALLRVRAALAAVAIARHYADGGRHVLLALDSATRLAMARREIGLAAGEPATARGYTPSVFAELPRLCERCGTTAAGGSVTALWTVLVEGDDLNDPVADSLRAALDGHIVLSRALAQQGHHPAIDVLASVSRLHGSLADEPQRALAERAVGVLALLDRHRELVDLGAYTRGSQPALDRALDAEPLLRAWARQPDGPVAREQSLAELRQALAATEPAEAP